MIGAKTTVQPAVQNVEKAASRSIIENIRHAAFAVRKTIRDSIKRRVGASTAGSPVNTRGKRGNVRNAYYASIAKDNAVIGPRYSFVADAMYFHEFGKRRGKANFPERPTSGPGLEQNTDRFANSFAGSIGE